MLKTRTSGECFQSTFLELRLLHLLHDIEVTRRKRIKHAFSVLHSDKTWVFDQSERALGPICIINGDKITKKPYTNRANTTCMNFAVVMIESPISLLLIKFEQT